MVSLWPLSAVTGVGLVAYSIHGLVRVHRARNWPTAEAQVVEATVGEASVVGRFRYTVYFPVIRYRYVTASGVFTSSRLSPASSDYRSTSRQKAVAFLAAYQPGAAVKVHVNPQNAEQAVLLPVASSAVRSHYLACLLAGLLVVLVSTFVALVHAP